MKSWIFGIIINAIFSSIITLILPEGKTLKTIKSVISLLLIVVILQPIVNINSFDEIFDILDNNEIIIQTSYVDYFNEKIVTENENKCVEILESYAINNPIVNIFYDTDENNTIIIKKIQIDLKNSVINSDKDNIHNIARVKNAIKNFLLVKEEQIEFYE